MEKLFKHIKKLVLSEINEHLGGKGEIIEARVEKGEIRDMGVREFRILQGYFFEVYCFKCFRSSFIRLFLESDERKTWISLDIDEWNPSPWFEE